MKLIKDSPVLRNAWRRFRWPALVPKPTNWRCCPATHCYPHHCRVGTGPRPRTSSRYREPKPCAWWSHDAWPKLSPRHKDWAREHPVGPAWAEAVTQWSIKTHRASSASSCIRGSGRSLTHLLPQGYSSSHHVATMPILLGDTRSLTPKSGNPWKIMENNTKQHTHASSSDFFQWPRACRVCNPDELFRIFRDSIFS